MLGCAVLMAIEDFYLFLVVLGIAPIIWLLNRIFRGRLGQAYRNQSESFSRITATMALPQVARADDVANAILYLASDTLARHVTGQTLLVAGGMEGRLLWEAGEIDAGAA